MANFEVNIIKIDKVEDHPNADRLSLNYFRDFITVSAKLEDGSHRYKEGDLAIYVPEGAIVPEFLLKKGFWNEEKNIGFLAGSKGDRVKAIKLRNIISQGIMFSVNSFDGYDPVKHFVFKESFPDEEVFIGRDVSEILGIIKYEPIIPASMSGEVCSIGSENTYKYDLENILKYPDVLQENENVVITMKMHGSQICMYYNPEVDHPEIWDNSFVCSKGLGAQGLVFKNNEKNKNSNLYVKFFDSFYDKEKFENLFGGKPFALFGEICGKGVQDLHYNLDIPDVFLFDVRVDNKFLPWGEVEKVAEKLSLKTVPVLHNGPWDDSLRELRNGDSIFADHIREGIVIKSDPTRYDNQIGRVILKNISEAYLLRKNGTEFN